MGDLQNAQLALKPEIKGGAALVVRLVVAGWQNDVELGEASRPQGYPLAPGALIIALPPEQGW